MRKTIRKPLIESWQPTASTDQKLLIETLEQFLEAASVAAKWRTLGDAETSLTNKVARIFKRQKSIFLAGFGSLRSRFSESKRAETSQNATVILSESLTADEWIRIYDDCTNQTYAEFFGAVQDAIGAAMIAGATEAIQSMGVGISFSLRHPRAEAYLVEHGSALITAINETTRGNIQTVIIEGITNGWSYQRVASGIRSVFDDASTRRAKLIAVTELGNAYESGTSIIMRELIESGMTLEKRWLTVGDDRVSDGCRSNEAEGWIPFAQSHSSGHQNPLRFPGCRCTELYRRKP